MLCREEIPPFRELYRENKYSLWAECSILYTKSGGMLINARLESVNYMEEL